MTRSSSRTPRLHRRPRSSSALRLLAQAALALVVTLGLLVATADDADAHPRKNGPFGIGVILGEPTGFTGKVFFDDMMALDFHLGLEGIDNDRHDNFGLYADLLFHFPVGEFSWATLPLYVGPGLALIITDDHHRYCTRFRCYDYRDDDDDVHLAIRAPFGLAFWFSKFGGEAFIEIALQLFVIQHVDIDLDLATGFRYYF